MKKTKQWVLISSKTSGTNLSESQKKDILNFFQPLVENLKKHYISKKPNRQFNFCIDIYSKWVGNYFYFCEKFKSEHQNRLKDEFEIKFVRLKCTGVNLFELSYFRHTGQWHQVTDKITLNECYEMLQSNPLFQPT